MATHFEVGDEVIVTGGDYVYTTPGSRGTIIKITDDYVYIRWSLIKRYKKASDALLSRAEHWEIDPDYLELVDDNIKGPYKHIIRKIKAMENKRKGLGYVF